MGRAIARSFALDGDRVVILGRREAVLAETAWKLNAEAGVARVSWHAVDLSVPEQVAPVAERIGSVDVLVNNAGGVDRQEAGDLVEVRDAWLRDLAGNVLTATLLTTALEPKLRRPGGRIVRSARSRASGAAGSPTRRRRPR